MAISDMAKLTMLFYGPPKIGKSTIASELDNPLFLAAEPGLGCLDTYEEDISSWKKFKTKCGEIQKGDHDFKTIVIDTVDALLMKCAEYICKEKGVGHESDIPHGKGYALITAEFQRVITKLAALPYGLVLISHSQQIEIDERTGKYMKTTTTLSGKQKKFVMGFVDLILYFDTIVKTIENEEKEIRIIKTKPSKFLDAGDRTGKLPAILKMDIETLKKYLNSSIRKEKETPEQTDKK